VGGFQVSAAERQLTIQEQSLGLNDNLELGVPKSYYRLQSSRRFVDISDNGTRLADCRLASVNCTSITKCACQFVTRSEMLGCPILVTFHNTEYQSHLKGVSD
jgi:hypothetical protein